jgi:hypothetical protein
MQRETRVERPAERHQLPVARRGYPRKQLDTSPYTHSDPESLATAVKVVSLTPIRASFRATAQTNSDRLTARFLIKTEAAGDRL